MDNWQHPLEGALPEWLKEYHAQTEMGRTLRKGDAKAHLKKLDSGKRELDRQLENDLNIVNRCERITAQCETAIWFLMTYGIDPDEYESFRTVLEETAQHGKYTLKEAARIARLNHRLQSSKGEGSESAA